MGYTHEELEDIVQAQAIRSRALINRSFSQEEKICALASRSISQEETIRVLTETLASVSELLSLVSENSRIEAGILERLVLDVNVLGTEMELLEEHVQPLSHT